MWRRIVWSVIVFMLVACVASPTLAKELSIPDFATDPSGLGYSIEAMPITYPGVNNVTAITIEFGEEDDTGTTDMLRMNWQPGNADLPSQAGWSVIFGQDPDVTNHTLSLSIRAPGPGVPAAPPGGMTQVEVHIVDTAGLSCGGWGFNTDQFFAALPAVPVPMGNDPLALGKAPVPYLAGMPQIASMALGGLPPPPGVPPMFVHNVTINIGNGPVAGSAVVLGPGGPLVAPNYIIPAVAGSSLANAARLDFYENGVLVAPNVAIPIGAPAGLNNWWTNIQLTGPPPVAEPGVLSLAALGVVGMLTRRRRR
jgi:hypothetical protein